MQSFHRMTMALIGLSPLFPVSDDESGDWLPRRNWASADLKLPRTFRAADVSHLFAVPWGSAGMVVILFISLAI
jgi:hypothetical protein